MNENARTQVLEAGVASYLSHGRGGGRVVYQGEDAAVLATGRRVNHILHLLLTVVTGGLWLIPWLIISFTGGEKYVTLSVDGNDELVIEQGNRVA